MRELQNVVERAVILSEGDSLTADDLGLPETADEHRRAGEQDIPPGLMKKYGIARQQ